MTNVLIVGSNKEPVLDYLHHPFLLIDDGALIDQLDLPSSRLFDVSIHSLDPLKDMTYKRARDFIAVLDAVFPEGPETLTHKNSNFVLLKALLSAPERLDTLVPDTKDTRDAYQKIQTLLLSPVLKRVLTRRTNKSLKGTVLARLNRAELGDFDCFVLANLLISQYRGQVVIPDFGFYAHAGHTALMRQNRLVAGVNTLDEVPELKSQLLLSETRIASHSTVSDAAVLAEYAGILPNTGTFHDFIDDCVR
jgi:hypothetical protein